MALKTFDKLESTCNFESVYLLQIYKQVSVTIEFTGSGLITMNVKIILILLKPITLKMPQL